MQEITTIQSILLQILTMKPKRSPIKERQQELFRTELFKIIYPGHALVKMAQIVDWDRLDNVFGGTFCPDNGRPAASTRLMVALIISNTPTT